MLLIVLAGILTLAVVPGEFSFFYTALAYYASFIFSLCIHEASHSVAAYILGDKQQLDDARISLNPLRHFPSAADIFRPSRVMPVEVRVNRLMLPYLSYPIVKLAGPLINFIIFIVCIYFAEHHAILNIVAVSNFFIMASNLAPILCLDGGFFYVWILGVEKMTQMEGASSDNIIKNRGLGAKFYSLWVLVVWLCSFSLISSFRAVI